MVLIALRFDNDSEHSPPANKVFKIKGGIIEHITGTSSLLAVRDSTDKLLAYVGAVNTALPSANYPMPTWFGAPTIGADQFVTPVTPVLPDIEFGQRIIMTGAATAHATLLVDVVDPER